MRKNIAFYLVISCMIIITSGCNFMLGNNDKEVTNDTEEEVEEEETERDEEERLEDEVVDEDARNEQPSVEEEKEEQEEDINSKLGDYEIYIGGEMTETDEKIIINGESNLLPGSRVVGEVSVGDEEDQEFFADTTDFVEDDGSFYLEVAHHDLKKETEVSIRFHFDGQQDDEIKRHYGDRGQNLTGPYIYKHQGEVGGGGPQNIFKQAKAIVTFEPSKEKAVRQFKEPDWYPLPEDMGDPHVWIEVEDINNDEEYFYIHGRSNIVEGSNLWLEYNYWKEAETKVLPDGSFDFKFPYEYKEDTPFIIELWPSHWSQWNEVQEVYGSEGQKLVGELVEKDKHSDKQFIQKIVEQESKEINVPDNVELKIDGTEVTMLVPDNVLFDFDKYDLKDDSKKILKEIAKTLQSLEKDDLEIEINGHTDNVGDKAYNLKLSENRANEVKEYIEDQLDDKNVSFTTKGYGDEKPIVSNDDEKGQAKNRRVEIIINLR